MGTVLLNAQGDIICEATVLGPIHSEEVTSTGCGNPDPAGHPVNCLGGGHRRTVTELTLCVTPSIPDHAEPPTDHQRYLGVAS